MSISNTTPDSVREFDRSLALSGYPPLLDRKQVSKILGLSEGTVWGYIDRGRLPATRIGNGRGVWRIARLDLSSYIVNTVSNA